MQILLRKVCSTYTASYVKIEVRWDWGKVHRVRKKCQTVLSTWSGPLYSFGCHMMVLVRMPRVIDVQIAKFKFAKSSLAIFLSSIVFSLDWFCYKLSTHRTDIVTSHTEMLNWKNSKYNYLPIVIRDLKSFLKLGGQAVMQHAAGSLVMLLA